MGLSLFSKLGFFGLPFIRRVVVDDCRFDGAIDAGDRLDPQRSALEARLNDTQRYADRERTKLWHN